MLWFLAASAIQLLSALTVVQGQSAPPLANPHVGILFIFTPAQGACGFTNTSTQIVSSVSKKVFSTFPGATTNPNKNPICHHSVNVTYAGKYVIAPVVDFFTDPGQYNIGLSLPGFKTFAREDDGIVKQVTWSITP